ncbi:MAG: DUF3365 domain-containing protein [Chlorobiales bacterium]|nr:DUF3365 domain-containing protein [Chlorobiales bacterium]
MMKKLAIGLSLVFFAACSSNQNVAQKQEPVKQQKAVASLTEEEKQLYVNKGKDIVQQTMKTLGGSLTKAISQSGVGYATKFCNLKAYPLVDSLKKSNHAEIRRATLKARNSNNLATPQEEQLIMQYAEQLKAPGAQLKPVVMSAGVDSVAFFAPIQTNDLCLKCHGSVGTDVSEKDNELIKSLYPNDKAVGYKAGELRGIWSITFPMSSK